MPSRRQEKIVRVIKESVSDAIMNHLSDPRIEGFVSITRVDVSPDLKNADVYISIFGVDEKTQKKTFIAIEHAHSRLQSFVAAGLQSKYCPSLRFCKDVQFKKTLDIMNLIDEVASEFEDADLSEEQE